MKQNDLLNIKTLEELHSNPNNLNFYLAKNNLLTSNFEIIKKQTLNSNFGEIELAIIGSSHYFILKNSFIEIMTCSEEDYNNGNLIFKESKQTNFKLKHNFESFLYTFSVETEHFNDTASFLNFEKSLLENKEGFYHAFDKQSAITSINYTNTNNKFSLLTFHTYPEYNTIIRSETELINNVKA